MKRFGTPQWKLTVWGDWHTVISSRKYRDVLIDQNPFDEDQANYWHYSIPCETTSELVDAYVEFHNSLKLQCAFTVSFEPDKTMRAFATTGTGYGNNVPQADVNVDVDDSKLTEAIQKAVAILEEAIK